MNPIFLYGVFETNRKHKLPDLNLGMAHYRVDHPEITDDEANAAMEFIGRHYDELVEAYAIGSMTFLEVVSQCEAADKEAEANV